VALFSFPPVIEDAIPLEVLSSPPLIDASS
jgi:hypothetical protein